MSSICQKLYVLILCIVCTFALVVGYVGWCWRAEINSARFFNKVHKTMGSVRSAIEDTKEIDFYGIQSSELANSGIETFLDIHRFQEQFTRVGKSGNEVVSRAQMSERSLQKVVDALNGMRRALQFSNYNLLVKQAETLLKYMKLTISELGAVRDPLVKLRGALSEMIRDLNKADQRAQRAAHEEEQSSEMWSTLGKTGTVGMAAGAVGAYFLAPVWAPAALLATVTTGMVSYTGSQYHETKAKIMSGAAGGIQGINRAAAEFSKLQSLRYEEFESLEQDFADLNTNVHGFVNQLPLSDVVLSAEQKSYLVDLLEEIIVSAEARQKKIKQFVRDMKEIFGDDTVRRLD